MNGSNEMSKWKNKWINVIILKCDQLFGICNSVFDCGLWILTSLLSSRVFRASAAMLAKLYLASAFCRKSRIAALSAFKNPEA